MNLHQSLEMLKKCQKILELTSENTINATLNRLAQNLEEEVPTILKANKQDLNQMDLSNPKYDRLALTTERIKDMAHGIRKIANLKTPIGSELENRILQNELKVKRISVPLGVIGMIYEARPNVTTDAFAIAFKTQNAIALKGGSDAQKTNQALVQIIQKTLRDFELPENLVYLLPPEREHAHALMEAIGIVDVIIPRGSQNLIKFVQNHAKVPIIETGAGIVHTYWDESGRLDYAKKIVYSAKTRRPSVCNALDTLIIHESNLSYLTQIVEPLIKADIEIRADEKSSNILNNLNSEKIKKASSKDFGTEFLGPFMSIKTVNNLDEAISHILLHSSKHSESIITENKERADKFLKIVDAACVFHNTETGFSDGEQLELGAEIGISTQKLHARGPMGLEAMTSFKWIIQGEGQTRI